VSRLASAQAKFVERVNRRSLRRPFPWLVLVLTAAFASVPPWLDDVQLRESLLLACVYITLASNLNLMIGYAGYVNFGNIVFFGLGGYICIYLIDTWHWPLIAAALAAGLGVSAAALVFGLGILRLRGAFFALATIGVNEAVKAFVVKRDPALTEDELKHFVAEQLTNYKRPKFIEFRDELPKTPVGKILRRALRDEPAKQKAA